MLRAQQDSSAFETYIAESVAHLQSAALRRCARSGTLGPCCTARSARTRGTAASRRTTRAARAATPRRMPRWRCLSNVLAACRVTFRQRCKRCILPGASAPPCWVQHQPAKPDGHRRLQMAADGACNDTQRSVRKREKLGAGLRGEQAARGTYKRRGSAGQDSRLPV